MAPRRSAAPGPSAPTLLKAKLQAPQIGSRVLERTRLIEALAAHADTPVSLVVADAGYGKTTLLAAASRKLRRPVVWYSLMASDADPVVFGRYLLEAFRRHAPRFGRDFERALADAEGSAERSAEVLGGVLANATAELRGPTHLLVLDDFHEVAGDPGVVRLVDVLLRHLPERLRVWIAAREAPPLALERLRARGELFELHSAQLGFTRDELGALFRDVYGRPIADAEVGALEAATSGWPTAVHLVHESLDRAPEAGLEHALAQLRASPLELHAYLSAEVLPRLDPAARAVLERTAPLERFDLELARTLTTRRDVRDTLEALAQRGLLRAFGDGAQATWSAPDLIRGFVKQAVEARDGPEAWRALHREAAGVLRARGEGERALRHAIEAGAIDEAAALVRELAPALLRQGAATSLESALRALPDAVVDGDLELLLARADAHQALGRWDVAEQSYTRALETARAAGSALHECRAIHGLGRVLNLRGRHEHVLEMTARAHAIAGDAPLELRVRLLQLEAAAHYYLGQYGAAGAILDRVREMLGPAPDPELLLPTIHNRAVAFSAQGHHREGAREFRAALALVRGAASPRAPRYLANLASLLLEMGELAEARAVAEEGLASARRFSHPAHEVACLQALGEALARSGDLDGAFAALRRAEDLNAELRMEVITAELFALRGRIFLARGQYRRAAGFLVQAIERLDVRPESPRRLGLQATLAWCELRSGRPHAARDLLVEALPAATRSENDYVLMRVRYWLAESLLALREPRTVGPHLTDALRRARERGYGAFLASQAREQPAPLLHALAHAIEIDACAAALSEAGRAVEEPLLAIAESAPTAAAEAALSVLGEIGGPESVARLGAVAQRRRALAPAARTALAHVEARDRRGRPEAAAAPADTNVRLVLFGPPRLEVGGVTLPASTWRSQRAFHILIFLALRARGAGREEILERFWPGRQAAAGRRNFHPTLSYIRSVLPRHDEPVLARDAETYRVNSDYPLTCDLWDFEAALEAARRARGADRVEALECAAALAERPPLEGLYSDWASEAQSRVRDKVETLLLDLGRAELEAGRVEAALAAYRRATELDEFRESTRVSVIECLIKLGNRRAAIVEYERLKQTLRNELDVEPLPETAEAIQRLLGPDAAEVAAAQRDRTIGQAPIKPATGASRP